MLIAFWYIFIYDGVVGRVYKGGLWIYLSFDVLKHQRCTQDFLITSLTLYRVLHIYNNFSNGKKKKINFLR